MTKQEKNFQIVIFEPHLLGDIRKCLKILDNSGKYLYIKHFKDKVNPHYHIYYSSNTLTNKFEIEFLFLNYVASRVFVDVAKTDKYPFIMYMLENERYRLRDIKGTLSLE